MTIIRTNYLAVQEHLKHLRQTGQMASGQIPHIESHLKVLLRWADKTSFENVGQLRTSFPQFLLNLSQEKRGSLSAEYARHLLLTSRRFFGWFFEKNPSALRKFSPKWISSLTLPKDGFKPSAHRVATLEQVLSYMRIVPDSLNEKRTQAAIALLFLTGMRVGTLMSIPLNALDLEAGRIKQGPRYGSRTKYKKNGVTHLLPNLPVLNPVWAVVRNWTDIVRECCSSSGLWFAPLAPLDGTLSMQSPTSSPNRDNGLRKDIEAFAKKCDLVYLNPHSLRHGHAHYFLGLHRDKSYRARRTLSRNFLHDSVLTTEEIYLDATEAEQDEDAKDFYTMPSKEAPSSKLSTKNLQSQGTILTIRIDPDGSASLVSVSDD